MLADGGAGTSVLFAQRYPGGRLRTFTTVGNAPYAGEGEGLF